MKLKVPYRFQLTHTTCGPACLQMMLAHAGVKIGHFTATVELAAFPNGSSIQDFQTIYKRLTGRVLSRITFRGVKRALNRGVPVLAVDTISSPQDHVVVIYGYEEDNFFIHDPALISLKKGFPKSQRTKSEIIAAANDEFYAPRKVRVL